jgi:lysophospholipase L1-like esterase
MDGEKVHMEPEQREILPKSGENSETTAGAGAVAEIRFTFLGWMGRELMNLHLGSFSSAVAIKLLTAAFTLIVAGSAAAVNAASAERHGSGEFLALGDSVVFGYITQAGYAYGNPDNFVGYPEYVGRALSLDATNAACPGETTSGFISATGSDNGCRSFKQTFPLHASYASTQLVFAKNFLTRNRHVKLVTVALGANDLFVLERSCQGVVSCIQEGLSTVLATVRSNMDFILGSLRATGFRGVLVVVNYYSVDYTDPYETGIIQQLNQVLAATARAHGASVADAYSAFQTAASTSAAGGMTCVAGLLNADPQNEFLCDVHPAQSGQRLLSSTVKATYKAARHRW